MMNPKENLIKAIRCEESEWVPDLIEMGLDILNPLQPECNDIEKIKSEFGKNLAFHKLGRADKKELWKGSSDLSPVW